MTPEEAIKILKPLFEQCKGKNECLGYIEHFFTKDEEEALDLAIKKVEHTRWIPCSERLPEEDGFYLATLDGEICGEDKPFSGLAEFENGKWVDDEEDYQCVIAWMPLPEPYAESEE